MKSVLLDTHAWAWSLTGDPRLSATAVDAITRADSVLVSPITFFEIGQKVRIGKWPEMAAFVADLPDLLARQGGRVAPLDPVVCTTAGTIEWTHRDPFDRLIAATARHFGLPLVSTDTVFDGLVTRIW